ncbi:MULTISPECIES: response regulator transcription factor [unclassified Motilimonas]|uniref:response regulator transcription factor n=1 Tax=Motilimonas TaxID=1914248 RepID=UPI001E38BDD7|nr:MULTISPECIES: response regulator transcription factor [unclassified Motilimonas]MCE0555643.1 response regulator transcription factor [Motilimonas sp. E26]MDO6526677.1 response regulator transcription factor [Motilimonas sp. 1_MG-2023]
MNIKIAVIDDHHLFLHGMELILKNTGAEVVIFESAASALGELSEVAPDLILMDLSMPEMDGFSMIHALAARDFLLPIAVVSASEDISQISDALDAGAMGFIPKSYPPDALVRAIESIIDGHIHVPESIALGIKQYKESLAQSPEYSLSPRQMDVLKLLAKGYPNKKVADILNISEDTVKFHLRGLFKILGVSNRTESVTRANELGLLSQRRA